MKNTKYLILGIMAAILVGGGLWFFNTLGEFEKPTIQLDQSVDAIGRQKVLDLTFRDAKSGLRKTQISITQDNKTTVVSSIDYPERGVREKTLSIPVDPWNLKLHEGTAILTITAVDHSLWKNESIINRQVSIDITPPQIFLYGSNNYINPGGTCMILMGTSKPLSMIGVQVENRFFPGYPIVIAGKPYTIVYFALPVTTTQGQPPIRVIARDMAGNEAATTPPHLIKAKKFRSDSVTLSDNFLQQKMPEFQMAAPDLRGKSLIDTFIYVNSTLRDESTKTIQVLCKKSDPRQLWQGTFLRMKNASPMALFGDRRTWMYQGKSIGESLHEGVDLASTTNAAIEAANDGVVAHTGVISIYGNTVIIDHGLSIFSLYGHLSSIHAKIGQTVKKGDVIGQSGATGLAGGDHMHFGILVGGQFVNPDEWWDPHWIADNVTKKLAFSP